VKIEENKIKGLYIITPTIHSDDRGFLMEVFHEGKFKEAGIEVKFVQDNQSQSQKNVVRELHFQWDKPLGKLFRVIRGSAFMVAVDIRKNSETLGQWFGEEFNEENKKIIFAPPGFATGFCALEDKTDIQYKYTALYNPDGESNILWNDKRIGIKWPIENPILSERDSAAQTLDEWLIRPESNYF